MQERCDSKAAHIADYMNIDYMTRISFSDVSTLEMAAIGEKVAGSVIGPHERRYMEFKVGRRKWGLGF